MKWSGEDIAYLLQVAGKQTPEEIGRVIGKTPEAVRQQAKRLTMSGRPVSLRLSRMNICPTCGQERSRWALATASKGMCRVCEKRAQLQAVEVRMADLMATMPAKDRATYAKTESLRESKPLPRPKQKKAVGKSPAQKAKAAREHALALEAWEIGCLQRNIKAASRRAERMEKKCRDIQ